MIIAFFGHAQFFSTEEYERKLLDFLEVAVGDQSADFYLGDYGEFDHFVYNCCKRYQITHPNVKLVFITPYITEKYQKNKLEVQKKRYDEMIYPDIEDKPLKYAISYRNRWMVEQADCVVFGIYHKWGGAYQAYKYAKSRKKELFRLTEIAP